MNAIDTVAAIVSKVTAHLKIADVPTIVDAATAHKAADALSYEAQYSETVRLAAHAARRIGWGVMYYREALEYAEHAEQTMGGAPTTAA